MTSYQEDARQHLPFNQLSFEAHVSRATSGRIIVNSIVFDPLPKLDLSPIYSGSQYYWSCESQSTDDSNFCDWVENSGFLDETFSSLLLSISKAQTSLDINCSHLNTHLT